MSDNERKAENRAKRDQGIRDIEASLDRATDQIASSKGEVARSQRLMKESDGAQATRERSRDSS